MNLDDMVVRVHPGDGFVGRFSGLALLILAPSPAQAPIVDQLLAAAETASERTAAPGRRVARQIAGILSAAEPEAAPHFCLLAQADDGLALILHGDIEVVVTTADGTEHLSGRQVATWVDRIIQVPLVSLVVGVAGYPVTAPDPRVRLGAGVVSGGGLSVGPVGSAAPQSGALPPGSVVLTPRPPTPRSFESVVLQDAEPEELRQPLPIVGQVAHPVVEEPIGPRVKGVICSRGHFNDPSAPFCGACGISMVQKTLNLVEGPRPPLGVIVFDDGATYILDLDYVMGREPELDPSVMSGAARPLAVNDPDRTVSRVHASVILDGWSVKAVDRGSANGTYVGGPTDQDWIPLVANEPTTIKPGTRVRLGQRVLLFDSHQGMR